MSDLFLNNNGAGTYGGEVWGEGSEANDGLSRSTPKLDANATMATYLGSTYDGFKLTFAAGDYEYTDSDGRYLCEHELGEFAFDEDFTTRLIFNGSNSQGFRVTGSSTQERKFIMGKCIVTGRNASKTQMACIVDSITAGSGDTVAKITLDWSAILQINTDNTASDQFGLLITAPNHDVIINDGGVREADGSEPDFTSALSFRAFTYSGSTVHQRSRIKVNSFPCNCRGPLKEGTGLVYFAANSGNPEYEITDGKLRVRGITGTIKDTNATSIAYAVKADNWCDRVVIEDNNDLSMYTTNAAKSAGLFQITGEDFDSRWGSIRNNKRNFIYTGSGGGLAIIIGA